MLVGAAALGTLSGCGGLPKGGPPVSSFDKTSVARSAPALSYALLDVTEANCAALVDRPMQSLQQTFSLGGPPLAPVVGVGDVVSVTLWEAGPGGLFSTPAIGVGGHPRSAQRVRRTRLRSVPSSSIAVSTMSPSSSSTGGFLAMPTPPGVPVSTTSPGRSRVNREM